MENINNKRCITCNELSPAELDKCQYCGSVLIDLLDKADANSNLDMKITIGNKEEVEYEPSETFNDIAKDLYEEKFDKEDNDISNNQIQFNNIFGFKSTESIPKVVQKNHAISNKRKVLLTVICSIIPGFGQLFCLILSLGYMNSEENEDRKSFGQALFVAALVMFVITCVISFIVALAIYQPPV